jgi:Protein of unknown function (DUF1566)
MLRDCQEILHCDGGVHDHEYHLCLKNGEADKKLVRESRPWASCQFVVQHRRGENTMKHGLMHAFALVAAALLALGAGSAAADAIGPYYATPSWDQQLPASTRFVVLSNWVDAAHPSGGAAVLDRETGLVWQKTPQPLALIVNWVTAQALCNSTTTGGRLGWRLPTIQELASLVDLSVAAPGPTLPAGHPFQNVVPAIYWSATPRAGSTDAWTVDFENGSVTFDVIAPDVLDSVWCVRSGGSNPQ